MKKLAGICMAAFGAAAAAFTISAPAQAGDYSGDFMIRAGVSGVLPNSDFGDITTPAGAVVLGPGNAEVDDAWIPSLTLSYFLNKNLAVELFCCFAKHDADGKGLLNGTKLGDTWIFPPALTLQYHFDSMGGFKPYLGAGVQYIHFFNEDSAIGGTMDIDDAWGFTLQAGADMEIGGGWYLNADVKYTWLDTEVHFRNTAFDNLDADFDLDPLIVSLNVGYRFNLFNRAPAYEPMK